MTDIVILAAARTPLGAFQGAFRTLPAPRLGAAAIRSAIGRAGLSAAHVTDVALGCVLAAGQGQAPARQATRHAGLPDSVRTVTINKVCGSGLQAVLQSAQALAAGQGVVHVAGGMENMSLAPYLLPKARDGYRFGHESVTDSLLGDGLWDPYHDLPMGGCAERCAEKYQFSREQQDAFAIESFRRAQAAQRSGLFGQEITPVELTDARGGITWIEADEGPARVKYEKIPTLKPAFASDGTITAANASALSDGAAALVLSTAAYAQQKGLKPIARLVACGAHAQEPLWFTTAPGPAVEQALQAAGWTASQVDLWEVNEAFAVVPLAFMEKFGLTHRQVNVRGGAIALGHPLGASGARILVTLLAALQERGLQRGVATVCIGGGEALAVCLELL